MCTGSEIPIFACIPFDFRHYNALVKMEYEIYFSLASFDLIYALECYKIYIYLYAG